MAGMSESHETRSRKWRKVLLVGIPLVAIVVVGLVALLSNGDDEGAAANTTDRVSVDDPPATSDGEATSESSDDGSATTTRETATSGGDGTTTTDGDDAPVPTIAGPDDPLTPPATAEEHEPVGVNRLPTAATGDEIPFSTGLVVSVTEIAQVDVDARAPGETAGPAVAVQLEVRNDSDEPIDLIGLAVTAVDDEEPLVPNYTEPADPLSGVLAPGETGEGTYVFRVDDYGGEVVVDVYHSGSPDVAVVTI